MELLGQMFLFLRGRSNPGGIESEELFALADALHNVPSLLTNYGDWIDDEKFREVFLRPFDRRWSVKAFSLEQFLNRQMALYAEGIHPMA